jgi:hypothetical protein
VVFELFPAKHTALVPPSRTEFGYAIGDPTPQVNSV